jgi:anaphase-promoting complex subunit 8
MVTLAWNPDVVCRDLQKACQILTERCLKLSAKWAAEQWMGLPPDVISAALATSSTEGRMEFNTAISTIPDELEWNSNIQNRNNPGMYYARTLLELGEYSHAAAVLSQTSLTKAASVEHGMPPPIPNLTPAGIYLRAYSLYLAGERRKEEERLVIEDNISSKTSDVNSAGSATRYV